MIEEGEIITLDNHQEYAVIQKIYIEKLEAFLLMSVKKPVKIKVCRLLDNGEVQLIDNPKIIKDALKQLV